jgi:hypothetical protein
MHDSRRVPQAEKEGIAYTLQWSLCFSFCPITFLQVFSSDVRYDYVRFVFTHILLCRECRFYLYYLYWCPTGFLYKMIFVSFDSNTTGVTSGARTVEPSGSHVFTPVFNGVHVVQCFDFCVVFCPPLFSPLSILLCFCHCIVCPSNYEFCFVLLRITDSVLSFFELRILFCPTSNYGFYLPF